MRTRWVVSSALAAALTAALAAIFALGSCSAGKPEKPEQAAAPEIPGKQVVAQVNGVPIYASDLNLAVTRTMTPGGQREEPRSEEEVGNAALQVLIENELLFQEARRRGFTAAPEAVDEEMAVIEGQFPGPATFAKALAQMSVTREDLRRDLERAQAVQRMIETELKPALSVSPEETQGYYDANPGQFTDPERVHARHVFLKVGPDTTEQQKAEIRRTLEGLRKRALQGESFATLADQYSQDPNSGEGGDLGYLVKGQLAKDFEKAVFALKDGEISGVVRSVYGYHLIQAVQHQTPTRVSFERVKESLTGFLLRRKLDETVSALSKELREKAEIAIPEKRK
jgi:parvulin-like peptidyl-prolyl isomerase